MLRRGAWLSLVMTALAALPAGARAADTYDIDPEHTEVRFSWNHLGLSRQGGRFIDVKGVLSFDEQNPAASTLDVTIPVKSIATGVKKLDEHLLASKEFFLADVHSTITYKSTGVAMQSDRTGIVTGELTINGITRPAVLDVVWNFSGEHPLANINPAYAGIYASGFSATTQIRRSDWGLTRTIPYISDEVKITIEAELHRRTPMPADGPADADTPETAGAKLPAPDEPALPQLPPAAPPQTGAGDR